MKVKQSQIHAMEVQTYFLTVVSNLKYFKLQLLLAKLVHIHFISKTEKQFS